MILILFPGPARTIVILGLTIWTIELIWTKMVLNYPKRQIQSRTK
jgi:hypothetical protein